MDLLKMMLMPSPIARRPVPIKKYDIHYFALLADKLEM
jgi:hypothetical protein